MCSAGRIGRGEKFPPQLGHTDPRTPSTQSRQNVHSKGQIIASGESYGRSRSQHSQLGRISSIELRPWPLVDRVTLTEQMVCPRLVLSAGDFDG